MKYKTLNTIAVIVTVLGGLLLIGTAGSLELDRITFTQAGVQFLIGLGITVLGVRLFKATYNPSDYNYEEAEVDLDD